MSRKVEELPIPSIPNTVDQACMRALAHYTVGFIRIQSGKHGKDLTLLGSGTLVTANGKHAILTAHHVVEIFPTTGVLGLVYSERLSYGAVSTDGLRYLKIARGTVDSEGPDLGAVILTPNIASSLGASKSFHNLDRNRSMMLTEPPAIVAGLWVVQGFIAERTQEELNFEERRKFVRFFELSSSSTARPYTVGDYDYFEVPIKYSVHASIPISYGGASGGGLWQVPLERKRSTGEIVPAIVPLLSGVAFYQDGTEAGLSAIRCHGRRSVYQTVYDIIAGS